MSPESESPDDYLTEDPRTGHLKYVPPMDTPLQQIRVKIMRQEHMVAACQTVLDTARMRLKDLRKEHTELLLADAEQADSPEEHT